MQVVSTPEHQRHAPSRELSDGRVIRIYEVPERALAIEAALSADGGFDPVAPIEHGTAPISTVHDAGLVAFLENVWADWREADPDADELFPDTFRVPGYREEMGHAREPASARGRIGRWCFDTATPIVEGTYAAARAAVDVALTAADLVVDGERVAYGLCRPPGHHAARAMFGGYCYFNNAAIVAEDLTRRTGEPVAILDVDYHHGNGTQQIFYSRGDVLYVSLHGDPDRAYPHFSGFVEETGSGPGEGANLNLPLPVGCSDAEYLAALDRGLEAIARFGGSVGRLPRDRHVSPRSDLRPRAVDRGVPRGGTPAGRARAPRGRPSGGRLLRAAPRRERAELAPRTRRPRGRPLPTCALRARPRGRPLQACT